MDPIDRRSIGYRPYPPGAPGEDRIRQVLSDVDKILSMVEP